MALEVHEANLEAVNYPKVVLEEATPGKKNRNGTTAKEPVVKRREKQQGYEDRARRTSKIWSNDEKNREEQSQRQAEEHSQQQAEANQRTATEIRRSTRRSTSQRKAAASQSRSIQEPMQMSSRGNMS